MSSYKQAGFRAEIGLLNDTKKWKGVERHQYNKKGRKAKQIKKGAKNIKMGKERKRYKIKR